METEEIKKENELKRYELSFLLSSTLEEEEAKNYQEKIASLLKEKGASLDEILYNPAIRKLAYPIKNSSLSQEQNQAYLASLTFKLSPEKLADLEKQLKEEEKIIRFLITNFKETKAQKKPARIPRFPRKPVISSQKTATAAPEKKVELKEIEQKLDEILKEDESQ